MKFKWVLLRIILGMSIICVQTLGEGAELESGFLDFGCLVCFQRRPGELLAIVGCLKLQLATETDSHFPKRKCSFEFCLGQGAHLQVGLFYYNKSELHMCMLWTQRAFGPDASGPRVFWSGRIRTKTSGPNTPKIKLSLQGALGPRPLVPTHP